MPPTLHILMICGSLRSRSTNLATLETAGQLAPSGMICQLYTDMANLPHFNPDHDFEPLPEAVAALRGQIAAADALLFCIPEYAGALPGSFKNVLDWTVGGPEMQLKPVAWINTSGRAAPHGGNDAHDSLRNVLGYVNASILERACVRIPIAREMVGEDGIIGDLEVRQKISTALERLAIALAALPKKVE